MNLHLYSAKVIATIFASVPRESSALHPASAQSAYLKSLWDHYLHVCVVVYVSVLVALITGVILRKRASSVIPDESTGSRLTSTIVAAATALTVITLIFLLFDDHIIGRSIRMLPDNDPLSIRVTAHQWWWEVEYQDASPSRLVITANELHLPIDRTAKIELRSADVIHSFWIPNLHGKRDMIPGRSTHTRIDPKRSGEFVGQCAEYCGMQHAKMRLPVTTEPAHDFERWTEAQRRTPPQPSDERVKQGQLVFMRSSCVLCHSIQGTDARGRVGPDLTHIASRPTLAGGSLPNTRGYLAGWITDPQRIKPGVRMPPNLLDPQELQVVLEYLGTLR